MKKLVLLSVSLMLAACATRNSRPMAEPSEPDTAPAISTQSESIRPAAHKESIAPGFEIQFSCASDPNINGKARVDFDGNLLLPYQVQVNAKNRSLAGLEQQVNKAYGQYFKSAPGIELKVIEKRYFVDVQGLVNKPGRYLLGPQGSLDEAISLAGGLQGENNSERAPRYARVASAGQNQYLKLSDYYAGIASFVPQWQGGESIFFAVDASPQVLAAQSNAVQVLGQVRNPGEFQYLAGADVYHYLARSGGPDSQADLGKVELIRYQNNSSKSHYYNLEKSSDQRPEILAGDILVVHPDRPNRVVSNVSGIMSSLASAVIIAFGF